jgi:hypothetical protein
VSLASSYVELFRSSALYSIIAASAKIIIIVLHPFRLFVLMQGLYLKIMLLKLFIKTSFAS